ncbi:hypothetical protein BP5796_03015 [Coleophoma crateriformis]|uniref:Uncharacterized protein n=1 Tax=Coleophoma crateriformis TaxID=565419 RepID=A0A3D8SMB0_9HELO|nr:hypothetical protein BP5796_03015 [Coleophoma crateriformis]
MTTLDASTSIFQSVVWPPLPSCLPSRPLKAVKLADATLKEKLLQMGPLGTVLIMGALAALLLALQYGGIAHAWDSSVVIGLLVGFVVIVLSLMIIEIRQGGSGTSKRLYVRVLSLRKGHLNRIVPEYQKR